MLSPLKYLKIQSAWFVSEAIKNKNSALGSRWLGHCKEGDKIYFDFKRKQKKTREGSSLYLLLASFEEDTATNGCLATLNQTNLKLLRSTASSTEEEWQNNYLL